VRDCRPGDRRIPVWLHRFLDSGARARQRYYVHWIRHAPTVLRWPASSISMFAGCRHSLAIRRGVGVTEALPPHASCRCHTPRRILPFRIAAGGGVGVGVATVLVGAPWWVGLLCVIPSMVVEVLRLVLPQESQDRLSWWQGYWAHKERRARSAKKTNDNNRSARRSELPRLDTGKSRRCRCAHGPAGVSTGAARPGPEIAGARCDASQRGRSHDSDTGNGTTDEASVVDTAPSHLMGRRPGRRADRG
jgi:hypothetical protein